VSDLRIREYNPEDDECAAFELWQRVLGLWPLAIEDFRRVICGHSWYRSGDCLVADTNGTIAGFVATQAKGSRGSVPLIMVDEGYRRRGIGRSLLNRAVAHLRARRVSQVQLGGGGAAYFWPGVPVNLTHALRFFPACGWSFSETSVDMCQDITGFTVPSNITGRVRKIGVDLRLAGPADAADICCFEQTYFPEWYDAFRARIDTGELEEILIAHNRNGDILGTVILLSPGSSLAHGARIWRGLLGDNLGGFGCLGVAPPYREQGIGLGLAATATRILRDRGVVTSFVGWTWLIDWYRRIGYRVWREYQMSWRTVNA